MQKAKKTLFFLNFLSTQERKRAAQKRNAELYIYLYGEDTLCLAIEFGIS